MLGQLGPESQPQKKEKPPHPKAMRLSSSFKPSRRPVLLKPESLSHRAGRIALGLHDAEASKTKLDRASILVEPAINTITLSAKGTSKVKTVVFGNTSLPKYELETLVINVT
mmetsp:Transcript_9030/g.10328  ORF Transcript_9030/g.10328 Transcript_9030/m.10328 type:complete len:112 (+) Transcript_9030:342-677(+)